MSDSINGRKALDRIAHDPLSRRRFLAIGGGTTTAGALLAACGDDDDERCDHHGDHRRRGDGLAVRRGRPRDRQLRAHARVPRGGVLRRRRSQRAVQGRRPGADQGDRQERAGARRRAHGDGEAARRPAGRGAEDGVPARRRRARCSSSRRRSRTSAPRPISGQAANIEDPEILAARSRSTTVEGRHAAALNVLTGQPPTPDGAFAKPADMQTVLDEVQPFIA